MRRKLPALGLVLAGLWLSGVRACACATCYGASDAPMAHGMNMGILALLLIVAFVLSSIAACFIALGIRARRRAGVLPVDPYESRCGAAGHGQDWEVGVVLRR